MNYIIWISKYKNIFCSFVRCKCPDDTYRCVRTGENVSMSAYVYHCRQNTTSDDIEGETSEDMDYLS